MKLTDTWSIENYPQGVYLIKKLSVLDAKTKAIKDGKERFGQGTLYQALQLFLKKNIDISEDKSIEDVKKQIIDTLQIIDDAKDRIKKEFRVEVYKC